MDKANAIAVSGQYAKKGSEYEMPPRYAGSIFHTSYFEKERENI